MAHISQCNCAGRSSYRSVVPRWLTTDWDTEPQSLEVAERDVKRAVQGFCADGSKATTTYCCQIWLLKNGCTVHVYLRAVCARGYTMIFRSSSAIAYLLGPVVRMT